MVRIIKNKVNNLFISFNCVLLVVLLTINLKLTILWLLYMYILGWLNWKHYPYFYTYKKRAIVFNRKVIWIKQGDVDVLLEVKNLLSECNVLDKLGFCVISSGLTKEKADVIKKYLPLIKHFQTTPPNYGFWFRNAGERVEVIDSIINLVSEKESFRFNLK